jgi:hypothetical protein
VKLANAGELTVIRTSALPRPASAPEHVSVVDVVEQVGVPPCLKCGLAASELEIANRRIRHAAEVAAANRRIEISCLVLPRKSFLVTPKQQAPYG